MKRETSGRLHLPLHRAEGAQYCRTPYLGGGWKLDLHFILPETIHTHEQFTRRSSSDKRVNWKRYAPTTVYLRLQGFAVEPEQSTAPPTRRVLFNVDKRTCPPAEALVLFSSVRLGCAFIVVLPRVLTDF